ncbi:ASCH domain-containing protein [Leuconostoc inhae]|uniref:ASCH domain-containing protein n=1 Tax=Leuconostoc inhae TaxID=178001 RepID=UPI001C7DE0C3|nr:ASCH domain-containing protein [Leuconostoc inhae]
MAHEQIWLDFITEFPIFSNSSRTSWQFGSDPTALAQLVIAGKKTATSSYFLDYTNDNDIVPTVGHVNLILDNESQPKVITVNTKVVLQPYKQVDDEIAYLEGEGTRDLAYWHKVHEPFFSDVAQEIGHTFTTDDLIVTAFFEVLKIL